MLHAQDQPCVLGYHETFPRQQASESRCQARPSPPEQGLVAFPATMTRQRTEKGGTLVLRVSFTKSLLALAHEKHALNRVTCTGPGAA